MYVIKGGYKTMVKQIFEETIAKIEATRQRDVEIARQRAMQECIVPFNRSIDEALRNAIVELQTQYNAKVAEMQQSLELEKNALTEAAAKKKSENAELVLATAASEINLEADEAIKQLQKMISKGA